jgi:hypothetical protein
MHVPGVDVTTASMVADLPANRDEPLRVWVCLGNPCVGVYVPAFPPPLPAALGDEAQWQRFARLRERAEADPDALAAIRGELAPVEAQLWDEADALASAFDPERAAAFAATAWRPVDAALSRLAV